MFYKESLTCTPETIRFDSLAQIASQNKLLNSGVIFKQFSYNYNDAFGDNLVNIYTIGIPVAEKIGFGMEFSRHGDYCIDLTRRADKEKQGKLIGSLNCNFGLIVDEFDRYPVDLSYNLHIENGRPVQLPVVDKPAILIKNTGAIEMRFIYAKGLLEIGKLRFEWIGSQSKQYNYFYARERAIIYNSYNRGLLLVKDKITGSKKLFDPKYSTTPEDRRKIDLIVVENEDGFTVANINKAKQTHLFEGNFIISIPQKYAEQIRVGDAVRISSIDSVSPDHCLYGSTGSPLLVPDVREARKNILKDRNVQTRSTDNRSAYKKCSKFCRSCIVRTNDKIVFFLADARKGNKGQEGFSIYMLRYALAKLYPGFLSAVNVDGGNAPKLIIKKHNDYDVLGNLQYKNWPNKVTSSFSWNGYRGRKIPAIIYAYER